MLNGVIISQDKRRAIVHFDTHSVGLWHGDGKVENLVIWLLFGYDSLETMLRLEGDTVDITIEREAA